MDKTLSIIEPRTYTKPDTGEVVFVPIKVMDDKGKEVKDEAIIQAELDKYNAKVAERQAKTERLKEAEPLSLLERIEALEAEINKLKGVKK